MFVAARRFERTGAAAAGGKARRSPTTDRPVLAAAETNGSPSGRHGTGHTTREQSQRFDPLQGSAGPDERKCDMARPETHDDLPDYSRDGHLVARVEAEYVVKYPSLGQHLLAALAEAEHLGLTVNAGVITLPRTEAELDEALENAQAHWDRGRERYDKALTDRESIEPGIWRKITNDWARENDLPEIQWDDAAVTL